MDIKKLTTKEKLRLICGKDFWHTEDFGGKLPKLTVADGPVGLRVVKQRAADGSETSYPATPYPSVQLLANTWDRTCARKMGAALADDCLERDVDILLAPGVNIKRTPLCGRNFEYFSEDPLLAGEMAKAYILGLQENGAGACLKHFCCNNLEYDRLHQSSDVDERTLREIYYLPFEIACEAKPVSVMCSYNRINGTYGAEYKKGFEVLREEFGFDGAIFSDWGAVRDRTASLKAGLDLEMPFSEENYQKLCKDHEEGRIAEAELDACAERVLALISRCKEMREGKKHGLSYASFAYRDLTAEADENGVSLSFEVCNTSERAGKEVAQVYVRACAPVVYRPARELKAFEKIFVKGGGCEKVSLSLGRRAFAHWSAAEDEWCVSDGAYEILVGASSEDIRLVRKVWIKGGRFSLFPL